MYQRGPRYLKRRDDLAYPTDRDRDEIIFTITKVGSARPRLPSLIEDPYAVEDRDRLRLIRDGENFVETCLKIDYAVGTSPYYLLKDGKPKSSIPHKVFAVLVGALAVGYVFLTFNIKKADINAKTAGNKCVDYIWWLREFLIGCKLFAYWFQAFGGLALFRTFHGLMQSNPFFAYVYNFDVTGFVIALRMFSIIVNIAQTITGVDVIHTDTFLRNNWNLNKILVNHEGEVKKAFTKLIGAEAATPASDTNVIGATTVILGFVGMVIAFAMRMMQDSIHDRILITSVMNFKVTNAMKLDEGEKSLNSDMRPNEREALYRRVVQRYKDNVKYSEKSNDTISYYWPMVLAVDIFAFISAIFAALDGDYIGAAVIMVNVIKDAISIGLGYLAAQKDKIYKDWYSSDDTKEVLKLSSCEHQRMITVFNMKSVAFGSGKFQASQDLIVGLLGSASTFFFIAAESLGDNQRGQPMNSLFNITAGIN